MYSKKSSISKALHKWMSKKKRKVIWTKRKNKWRGKKYGPESKHYYVWEYTVVLLRC